MYIEVIQPEPNILKRLRLAEYYSKHFNVLLEYVKERFQTYNKVRVAVVASDGKVLEEKILTDSADSGPVTTALLQAEELAEELKDKYILSYNPI